MTMKKESLINTSEQQLVTQNAFEYLHIAAEGHYPFAFWRLPNSPLSNLVVDMGDETITDHVDIEVLPEGFLFSPFETDAVNRHHFIKADLHLEFKNFELSARKINPALRSINKMDVFFHDRPASNKNITFRTENSNRTNEASRKAFEDLVTLAIKEIGHSKMLKVVPSRQKRIKLPAEINFRQFVQKLCDEYPNAFVYVVSIPGVGTWIGATPENLISIDCNNLFKTTALAGTQSFDPKIPLADMAWRQKEIEEQAMVSRYIIDCFKKIRLREFEEAGPRTSRAGNLVHLKTDFIVDIDDVGFPQLGSVMLDLLHPTSAVCGTPKTAALHFLKNHEGYDRSYYAGFLGPVKIANETHLYVNLRCMQLLPDHQAMLYAGAGVTIDSVPENEWKETELKMITLSSILDDCTA